MKAIFAVLMVAAITACGPRRVEVQTSPTPASNLSLQVTNNAAQPVNVYVVSGGNDIFVGQVGSRGTQTLAVSGVSAGSSVTLRARLADGTSAYTKDNVILSGTYSWTVP